MAVKTDECTNQKETGGMSGPASSVHAQFGLLCMPWEDGHENPFQLRFFEVLIWADAGAHNLIDMVHRDRNEDLLELPYWCLRLALA